jgi:hypothetical protein
LKRFAALALLASVLGTSLAGCIVAPPPDHHYDHDHEHDHDRDHDHDYRGY